MPRSGKHDLAEVAGRGHRGEADADPHPVIAKERLKKRCQAKPGWRPQPSRKNLPTISCGRL